MVKMMEHAMEVGRQQLKDQQNGCLEEAPRRVIVNSLDEDAEVGDELWEYPIDVHGAVDEEPELLGMVLQIEWFGTGYRVFKMAANRGICFFTPYGAYDTMEEYLEDRQALAVRRIKDLGWDRETIIQKGENNGRKTDR